MAKPGDFFLFLLHLGGVGCFASTAYHNTHSFNHTEKQPYPKSGQEEDPDKPGCTMSCRGGLTDPSFSTQYNGPVAQLSILNL